MAKESERGGNYFALGTIVGSAIGVALALLFAPQPGEETRATLKEKGIELQQRARKATPESLEDGIETVKEDVVATAEKALEEARQHQA